MSDPNYLVMELIEGPTHSERIKTGPIPLDEALTIGRQIRRRTRSRAREGGHPSRTEACHIKLKPDGRVKVLDFGLAKMAEQTAAPVGTEESAFRHVAMGDPTSSQ